MFGRAVLNIEVQHIIQKVVKSLKVQQIVMRVVKSFEVKHIVQRVVKSLVVQHTIQGVVKSLEVQLNMKRVVKKLEFPHIIQRLVNSLEVEYITIQTHKSASMQCPAVSAQRFPIRLAPQTKIPAWRSCACHGYWPGLVTLPETILARGLVTGRLANNSPQPEREIM